MNWRKPLIQEPSLEEKSREIRGVACKMHAPLPKLRRVTKRKLLFIIVVVHKWKYVVLNVLGFFTRQLYQLSSSTWSQGVLNRCSPIIGDFDEQDVKICREL